VKRKLTKRHVKKIMEEMGFKVHHDKSRIREQGEKEKPPVANGEAKSGDGKISNAEFAKELKTGAAGIAADIPAKFNDETARIIQTLVAMSQHDTSAFNKMVGYADNLGAKALEKSQSSSTTTTGGAATGDGLGGGVGDGSDSTSESVSRYKLQKIIREEIIRHLIKTSKSSRR
jgi:hypothetical protein